MISLILLTGCFLLLLSWSYMALSIPFYFKRKSIFSKIFPVKLKYLPLPVSIPLILNIVSFTLIYFHEFNHGSIMVSTFNATNYRADLTDILLLASAKSMLAEINGMELVGVDSLGRFTILIHDMTNLVYSLTILSFLINLFLTMQLYPSVEIKLNRKVFKKGKPAHVVVNFINTAEIPVNSKIHIILKARNPFEIEDYDKRRLILSEKKDIVTFSSKEFLQFPPSTVEKAFGVKFKINPLNNNKIHIYIVVLQEFSLKQEFTEIIKFK